MNFYKGIMYLLLTLSTFLLYANPAGESNVTVAVPSTGSSQQTELRAIIPFETVNDAIIVTLKLNDSDQPLRFLFDTGANGMAITKSLADSLELTVSHQQSASVVGADQNIFISSGNLVHLDTLALPQQNIAIFPEMGENDGIIGMNLAWAFVVKVDFDQSCIYLYDRGSYLPEEDEIEVPIIFPEGIIMIPSKLDLLGKGAVQGNFVFDTGAGFHVVAFSPFVRKNRLLLSGFKYESQTSMSSMGHSTAIYHGKATEFSFAGENIRDMPIALQASSGNDGWDPGIAGSIGIQLIKNYNFTIDLANEKLYLNKN